MKNVPWLILENEGVTISLTSLESFREVEVNQSFIVIPNDPATEGEGISLSVPDQELSVSQWASVISSVTQEGLPRPVVATCVARTENDFTVVSMFGNPEPFTQAFTDGPLQPLIFH